MSKFKSTSSLEVLLLWVWDTACLQDRRYMGAYNKTRYLQLERVLSGKRERHSHLIWESVLGFSTAPWPLTNLVICCSSHSCPEQYESGEPAGSGQWVNGVGKKPCQYVEEVDAVAGEHEGGIGGVMLSAEWVRLDVSEVCVHLTTFQNIRFGERKLSKRVDMPFWKQAEYTNTTLLPD